MNEMIKSGSGFAEMVIGYAAFFLIGALSIGAEFFGQARLSRECADGHSI